MRKFQLITLLLLFFSCLQAQTGFRYQAVIRDNAGQVVANQTVNLRFSIIEGSISNSAVYVETQQPLTDAYGVVSLTIGAGTVATGTFAGIDWSKDLFMQTELDVNGGTNFNVMGTSELLSVPKANYAERVGNSACAGLGICVTDYGAVGDNSTDDTQAFNDALTAAAVAGNRVTVPAGNYLITSTLVIPDGVIMTGEGVGKEPLQTPFNGSAIRYAGTGYAVQISGHTSGLRDLQIYDQNQGSNNAGGVHVLADGELVESCRLFNLLIQYFIGGTGLYLEAVNGGGIAYHTYYNVRVRNAKTGYHITEDGPSFTNSNVFHHGAISGGGFDYGIRISGGNNNQFYGTIIEPGSSASGHLVIEEGEIIGENIRIEANGQATGVPVIHCKVGTRNTYITGTYAGGLTLDEGDNFIDFRTGKSFDYFDSRGNLYENATFAGYDGNDLPFWEVTGGSGTTVEILEPELTPQHNVLKITVPAGTSANLEQEGNFIATQGDLPLYEQLNFGFYVKVSEPDIVYTRINSTGGVTISQPHHGDGNWHFVGMNQNINANTTIDARLEINNTSGAAVDVFISVPTFNFGNQAPEFTPKRVTSAGGIMTGTLSTGVSGFTPTSNFIVLEKDANVFTISGTQDIHRINHSGADKFPQGTVITLLFNDAGVSILDSVFIDTYGGYTSAAGSSLTLLSNGDGTWRELSRNL